MNSDFPYPGSGISTLADMLAPDATVDNYPIPIFTPPPAGSAPVLDFTLARDFHNFALVCDASNIFNTLICVPMVHTFHPRGDLNGDHYCIRMRMAHITEYARGYHDHYYRPHMVTFHANRQASGPRANEWLISAVHATH